MPREIEVKSILNKTKRRDPWFLDDYTLNLYSSCSFNCLYCYIRGSKYGENLEQSLSVKKNALALLERQLANQAKKNQHGFIVLSSATDPYIPLEKRYGHTREALKCILKYRFPVHIITKSDLVVRDFDLLEAISQAALIPGELRDAGLNSGTLITFSFSTLDPAVGDIFEPGAPSPQRRLEALSMALDAGFNAGVSLMPLLPFISDTGDKLHEYFSTFKRLGAKYVMPATLTLFGSEAADSKTLTIKAVQKYYPGLTDRYRQFFENNNQMPSYYQAAFCRKMRELALEYGLADRIVVF